MTAVQAGSRLPIISWRNSLACAGRRGPKPNIRMALMTMATRADNTTLEFFMTMRELGEWMGVSERTAERYIESALETGWIEVTEPGSYHEANRYRLLFGVSDNPEGVIPEPTRRAVPKKLDRMRVDKASTDRTDGTGAVEAEACTDNFDGTDAAGDGVSTDRTDGTCTDSFDGLTTPITTPTKNIRSTKPTDRTAKAKDRESEPLPDDWQPNAIHIRSIEKMGGDTDEMVDQFRNCMVDENRSDWDSAFGAYIRESEQGREDVTFPHYDPDDLPGPELPITWDRPDWLDAADERLARIGAMGGAPDDDTLCRALGAYLESCAELGQEPSSTAFPFAVRKFVSAN